MFENNPWNFTKYSEDCYQKYGIYSEYEKAVMMFGGRDITTATNIIFSNGLRDPVMNFIINQTFLHKVKLFFLNNSGVRAEFFSHYQNL